MNIKQTLSQSALKAGPDLLRMYIIRKISKQTIKAKIIETESYCGEKDLANHSSKGKTKRIGVEYAGPVWSNKLLRFVLVN